MCSADLHISKVCKNHRGEDWILNGRDICIGFIEGGSYF
jgi:hypothetical protein